MTGSTNTGLRAAFALDTRLFLNAVEGITDTQAAKRPDGRTNSIAFLAAHLVDVRHFTLGYLGKPAVNPLADTLRDVGGIEDVTGLPDLETLRTYWREVSTRLEAVADTLDADALEAPSPQHFPIDDDTVLGGLHFLLHHEAYHIGQLALLRKHHGLPAMAYR